MSKSIVIIGGGIAGLSTGCYAQMNGYSTKIFEMDTKPGGLCTSWLRKGYTIDGCLHWLVGSGPGNGFYRFWQEMGMLQGQKIVDMEQWYRYESADSKVFTLYTDVDKLEKHMLEIAPEDSIVIRRLCGALRRFTKVDVVSDKATEVSSLLDKARTMFKMLPIIGDLMNYGRLSMGALAAKFKNPLLKKALLLVGSDFSAMSILFTIAWMNRQTAGYVIGGSSVLAKAAEKRYIDLGGSIKYKAKVNKILVENGRAVGVRLDNGEEYRADYVVSAADGHSTIFNMLEGKYADDTIRGYYENLPTFTPIVYIGLGVNRSFSDLPMMTTGVLMELTQPLTIAGKEQKAINFRVHNFDPTLAPSGKTVITVMLDSSYEYWENLRQDTARYNDEKQKVASTMIGLLDKRFPGLSAQVEMTDVATPVTFERYTGNWRGIFEGWFPTTKTQSLNMKKTLPGLDGFYMVGQWVSVGGGLPSGVMTGRNLAQVLCKRDGKKFKTTMP